MPRTTAYPGVRITKDGKRLEIYFSHGTRAERKQYAWTLELSPTASGLVEASKIRETRKARIAAGLPAIEPDAANPTVAQVAMSWRQHLVKKGLKRTTINSYIAAANNYWLPHIADLRMRDLRFGILRDLDEARHWTSPKTRKNAISALSSLLQFAYEGDFIAENPAARFNTKLPERTPPEAYTPAERDMILAWLDNNAPRPTIAMYFTTAFFTGMRTGELFALNWSKWDGHGFEVDQSLDRGEIVTTKTNTQRYVPVVDALKKKLTAFRAEQMKLGLHNGIVFLNKDNVPYKRPDKINRWFHKACAETGVRDLMGRHAPYPWRKTAATVLYDQGADPYMVGEILGHSVETARKHYKAHRSRETLRDAMRVMK
jgi:integrase